MEVKAEQSIAVLGYGWLAQALDEYWSQEKINLKASFFSRSGSGKSHTFTLSERTQEIPKEILQSQSLLIALPPGGDLVSYCASLMKLATILKKDQHVVFISTTSVFEKNEGDCDESTTPLAEGERASSLLKAEEIFQNQFSKSLILRSAGQIGEDRAPVRTLVKKDVLPLGNIPVNVIHKDDLVRICTLALENRMTGILHAVSPYHPKKEDFYADQAKSLGLQLGRFPQGSELSKKIVGRRLMELNYSFVNEKCEI